MSMRHVAAPARRQYSESAGDALFGGEGGEGGSGVCLGKAIEHRACRGLDEGSCRLDRGRERREQARVGGDSRTGGGGIHQSEAREVAACASGKEGGCLACSREQAAVGVVVCSWPCRRARPLIDQAVDDEHCKVDLGLRAGHAGSAQLLTYRDVSS
jgi:hypothetical protein